MEEVPSSHVGSVEFNSSIATLKGRLGDLWAAMIDGDRFTGVTSCRPTSWLLLRFSRSCFLFSQSFIRRP